MIKIKFKHTSNRRGSQVNACINYIFTLLHTHTHTRREVRVWGSGLCSVLLVASLKLFINVSGNELVCGGCCRVPGCCSHATKSACFLGKRSGAKSRCRAAPWGGRPASSLQEVLWEQRGPGLESCQLLVMLVEWEPKSHLSFMDSADTCGIHLTMHWWRTRREREMENRFMTHQDHKEWITETATLTRL